MNDNHIENIRFGNFIAEDDSAVVCYSETRDAFRKKTLFELNIVSEDGDMVFSISLTKRGLRSLLEDIMEYEGLGEQEIKSVLVWWDNEKRELLEIAREAERDRLARTP